MYLTSDRLSTTLHNIRQEIDKPQGGRGVGQMSTGYDKYKLDDLRYISEVVSQATKGAFTVDFKKNQLDCGNGVKLDIFDKGEVGKTFKDKFQALYGTVANFLEAVKLTMKTQDKHAGVLNELNSNAVQR
jgi:hypothetical protein